MYTNSLTISAQDALSKLSWLQLHEWFGLSIATIIALLFGAFGLFLTFKYSKIFPVEPGAIFTVFLFLAPLGLYMFYMELTPSQIDALQDTPTKTISTQKYPIVSAQSASSKESSLSGNLFYVQGSSSDSTSYRYFIKTDNNIYQQHTLKEQFGHDIKAKNIYIKEDSHTTPMLVVKKVTYSDKTVRQMLSDNGNATTRTTYTFNVPKNSVITDFNFK